MSLGLLFLLYSSPLPPPPPPLQQEHPWILQSDRVLPPCEENCRGEIDVSEDDIKQAFKPFSTPIHILVRLAWLAVGGSGLCYVANILCYDG